MSACWSHMPSLTCPGCLLSTDAPDLADAEIGTPHWCLGCGRKLELLDVERTWEWALVEPEPPEPEEIEEP